MFASEMKCKTSDLEMKVKITKKKIGTCAIRPQTFESYLHS